MLDQLAERERERERGCCIKADKTTSSKAVQSLREREIKRKREREREKKNESSAGAELTNK